MRVSKALPLLACLATLGRSELQAERIVLFAGTGTGATGKATECRLHSPFGTVSDNAGNIYIVEYAGGDRLLKVDKTGNLSVAAGTGEKGDSGDGGPATQASFNSMHSLALGQDGLVYLTDSFNKRIRTYDPKTGLVKAFAGTGKKGFSGDGGPASKADFGDVYCAAFGPDGRKLYLADLDNRRIRMIDTKTGIVSTVAGNGTKGVPPDGTLATEAPLVDPRAVAVDSKNNIYILERGGNALRVVDPKGKIRTVAGTGKKGLDGDNGPALTATFSGPKHIWVDAQDDVLIADSDNHVIRKYSPKTGTIVRIAGTGTKGTGGLGGSPLEAELNQPHGVYTDRNGAIFISDSTNDRVLKIVK
jgi:sugar lactone lactonase YvrE